MKASDFGVGVERLDLLRHGLEMALAPGAEEIAGLVPVAGDVVAGDQVLDVGEGIGRIGEEGGGFFRAS